MKRILKEPELESDINSIPNTESEIEQGTIQETVDDKSLLNTLDIQIIRATLLA